MAGWMAGDAFGGFLFGGLVRIVFGHHSTFFVNSLAHIWGDQPYSNKVSARDNFLVALLTFGEGYHNFHHTFEGDYRNGIKWYQWDPTKWAIRGLAFFGQAKKLKRVPPQVLLKAKMEMQQRRVLSRGLSDISFEKIQQMRQRVELAQRQWRELAQEYRRVKRGWSDQNRTRLLKLKAEMKVAKIEFYKSLDQWSVYMSTLQALPA